ncbi:MULTISPECIES: branched-chain amino acid ABC transporter permease [Neobacillus]|uniref:Branched-chain amino acid ABC transporter permease n=1 Tax=Neobacillus rhizophilus TaxID=2833579 RepID=A0A942U4I9_9BACI|nr:MULTISPECIES: branched-chain amino acid ABC transporter permease [Neobacillus]MBS4212722.1 branched-chain amino acid ABC transporter permease [Neobacillus rhizophilus]MBU8915150.1 branched-chain amino acid ABC transporter permease [Bacillus sp. FJAT-29953]
MGIDTFINIILNGILIGGVYGLVASAFTFQAGALQIVNFSYGSSTMLAMYLTFFLIKEWNIPIVFAVVILFALFFTIGWIMRRTILNNTNHGTQILTTMAVELVIINLVIIFFTGFPRDMAIFEKRINITDTISVGLTQLICFFLAAAVLVSFHLFLNKTWAGMSIRAVVQKKEIANIMGINSERIMDLAFSISYLIIAIAGIMLMTMFQVEPHFGNYMMTISFLVCVTAGIGNMGGSFLSGIIIGILSALITTLLGAQFHDPVLFGLFVLILLVRPNGLFNSSKRIARQI